MENQEIDQLLTEGNAHLNKLRGIVNEAIKEQDLILNNLLHPPKEMLSPGQKISDKVARFGGSWIFIISFFLVLGVWILINTVLPQTKVFDPYPFILMNLILSCIAALQAPVIMMSQNRLEEKDRMREENDYMINLKAEIEIRSLHQKIDLLIEEQIKTLFDSQANQFILLREIKEKVEKISK